MSGDACMPCETKRHNRMMPVVAKFCIGEGGAEGLQRREGRACDKHGTEEMVNGLQGSGKQSDQKWLIAADAQRARSTAFVTPFYICQGSHASILAPHSVPEFISMMTSTTICVIQNCMFHLSKKELGWHVYTAHGSAHRGNSSATGK